MTVVPCDQCISVYVAHRELVAGDSGVVSSHKVVETTVHTVKTTSGEGGSCVSETKTTTMEELKTVEGIITSCMETTTSETTSATPSVAKVTEGINIEHLARIAVVFLVSVVVINTLLIHSKVANFCDCLHVFLDCSTNSCLIFTRF